MLSNSLVQQNFFENLKKKIPNELSIIDELAELLRMSRDSVYRRVRGDSALTFAEILTISEAYDISLDALVGVSKKNKVSFQYQPINENRFNFDLYFQTLLNFFEYFNAHEDVELIYAANEAKFQLLHVPEIAAFKLFFWTKTSYDFKEQHRALFNFEKFNQKYGDIIKKIVWNYVKIPTVEIINEDYLNSTFNQIRFYYDSGYFNSRDEALLICDKIKELLEHNRREAELGFKFMFGSDEEGSSNNLTLYHNDVILSDNVVAARLKEEYFCFLVINNINYLVTGNEKFSKDTFNYLSNLQKKSTLISVSAERERNIFYNKLGGKLTNLKAYISR
ncbi:MAG: helix-turn-helix transcriptional regulator [Reichenbachiella sp.]|uniref:helix-turn-helix transcriptional regulator n=1 Tax=Reichenbachiella sp. TaxID=2184521 RepID=UPI00329A78EC